MTASRFGVDEVTNSTEDGPFTAPFGMKNGVGNIPAAAGTPGEYLSEPGNSVSTPATNTGVDVCSLVLTPGIWMVWGEAIFRGATSNATSLSACVSEASGTQDDSTLNLIQLATTNFGSPTGIILVPRIFNVTANKTVYLVAAGTYSGGALNFQADSELRAVRLA